MTLIEMAKQAGLEELTHLYTLEKFKKEYMPNLVEKERLDGLLKEVV